MLQPVSSTLRRAVQNARFSAASTPTRALGLLLTYAVPHGCFLSTASTPRKMYGSTRLLRPMSSAGVQHGVRGRRAKRTVKNLDPNYLDFSDFIDLHGPNEVSVKFGTFSGRLFYHLPFIPFPEGSKGFLYLHKRLGLPAGAGEIRFRVVDTGSAFHSAADLFASGKDLLDHAGHRPWRIHMLQLYTTRTYDPIRRLLRSQGLIGESQDRDAEQRVSAVTLENIGRSDILDTISDTFVVQLPISTLRLAFIHDEYIVPPFIVSQQIHWRDKHQPGTIEGSKALWRLYKGEVYDASPSHQELTSLQYAHPDNSFSFFSGFAVVRFELKKVMRTKEFHNVKDDDVVLVLRILELLDPLGPDGVPFNLSHGGELAQREALGRCWSMSLDRARDSGIITPSSLKILEDLYLGDSASPDTADKMSPS
ncbi:hypothetical protein DFP72DRAFT_1172043 [Ephemerocybe angulata]|uniref:Uncharacterized protein n=1 Tax=Ephemerocybe angulata TaxID=980116 RepID=A0A8H6M3A1_9AGAR|nr:hypothetical protein DFP72DRAFT_1172043 [Tulosesus angulatus]